MISGLTGRFRSVWRPALVGLCALLLFALHVATLPPRLPSYQQTVARWQPSESWLYDRSGALIDSLRVNYAARRLGWVRLADMAPALPSQVIAAEDRRFYDHQGVDWLAMGSAVLARIKGQRSRGASTLSMQVAAYLTPQLSAPGARSLRDKLRQMRAGLALESNWSKAQILETYLNMAGFRGEAQGIGAAALGLFGKTSAALSDDEAILIAAMLPDPGGSPTAILRRACRIAPARCAALRPQTIAMTATQRQLTLDPGLAPHLAVKLLAKPGMRLTTTINEPVQRIARMALRRQLIGLGSDRVRDGAAIVVDNRSGDVLAYVGGVALGSTAAAVDGADAYRQAGSTLKPFLYAMALEAGWLTPASILDDSPVQLDTASGLYVPQNYDRAFKGPVSVRTALASSLNVPAVRTLLLTGTDAFRDRLWDTGFRGLTEDGGYYGFSLALGSAEVTLLEQAAAYRALARGGLWSPLRIRADDPVMAPRRVMSPQAAWLVSDILADPQARSATFGMDSALRLPFWAAVKTGTSKAMRDNWCVGYSDRFTVAVWVGNLEGDSMKAVSGTSGAAPIWRDIMSALHTGHASAPPPMVDGVVAYRTGGSGGGARLEYFLRGTEQSAQNAAPISARRPRIASPVSGSVFALDPDIPLSRQRMAVSVAGGVTGYRLQLNGRDIGAADSRPQLVPQPGRHRLALVDLSGRAVDLVAYTVR
jgi:penicillin-binding protein 1C